MPLLVSKACTLSVEEHALTVASLQVTLSSVACDAHLTDEYDEEHLQQKRTTTKEHQSECQSHLATGHSAYNTEPYLKDVQLQCSAQREAASDDTRFTSCSAAPRWGWFRGRCCLEHPMHGLHASLGEDFA